MLFRVAAMNRLSCPLRVSMPRQDWQCVSRRFAAHPGLACLVSGWSAHRWTPLCPAMIFQRSYSAIQANEPDQVQVQRLAAEALPAEERKIQLAAVDVQLKELQKQRDILSGDAFTYRGRSKIIARDYGMPFLVYWWGCWVVSGFVCYGAVKLGGVDAIALVGRFDDLVGTSLSSRLPDDLDPVYGHVAMAFALNECLEPVRLPLVLATTPMVLRFLCRV